jgi:hypothetical protein
MYTVVMQLIGLSTIQVMAETQVDGVAALPVTE